ncbi:hypothetical protein CDAR_412461 [Caerostris darwini]|uniref:Uncharacterized protein n=1 Tax=Caerostris darwini TaxID=1538125 RepID=A0AAV4WWF1_9ARAC|nr:hypothetical protein CDAR_412461 [Caerostris darwini]
MASDSSERELCFGEPLFSFEYSESVRGMRMALGQVALKGAPGWYHRVHERNHFKSAVGETAMDMFCIIHHTNGSSRTSVPLRHSLVLFCCLFGFLKDTAHIGNVITIVVKHRIETLDPLGDSVFKLHSETERYRFGNTGTLIKEHERGVG